MEELEKDIREYDTLFVEYRTLESNDYTTAYDLSKRALILADRWNEIMINGFKYAKELDIAKTKFETYCYQKWKMLMKMHDYCRMIFRQGKDGISNNFYNE